MAEKGKSFTPSEHAEQAAFFEFVRWKRLSDERYTCIVATPNAGKRSPLAGLRMVAEGMERGFPDISILEPCGKYHGLFIEMKIKPNRPTVDQLRWLGLLAKRGYAVAVCWSAKEAMDTVANYLAGLSIDCPKTHTVG